MDQPRQEFEAFRLHTLAVAACCLAPFSHTNAAFAKTEQNNNRMVFYGVGIGWGSLICDFHENQILNKTAAEVTIENIKSGMKSDNTYTQGEIGLIRSQAVKDGFNASAKAAGNCPFKF